MPANQNDAPKTNTISELSERMKRADWWHDYSDDGDVRQRGRDEIAGIYKDLRSLHATDPQAVSDLWQKHAPKEWFRPDYLLTPKEQQQEKAAEEREKSFWSQFDEKPSLWETGKEAVKALAEKIHKQMQTEKAPQQPTRERDNDLER